MQNELVRPRYFSFGGDDDELVLSSGRTLGPIDVCYETYGELNAGHSNAILIAHSFSGDAHAAGRHAESDRRPGWWDDMIGPGRAIDTERYFVICSNVLGGCQGTTGPSSIKPRSGQRYGLSFPVITLRDMVETQARLIDYLGIDQLLCVIGSSMGGMQALEWATLKPERVRSAIVIASTARMSAQGIAFNMVGRNAIMSDPNWRNGNYYEHEGPLRGLAIARMVGHITYLSDEAMHRKFGRQLQERNSYGFDMSDQFAVESYLSYQGDKFVDRFDANSYIYLTKAIDYFDLSATWGGLDTAFGRTRSRFLVLSFSSDWLCPPYQSIEIVRSMIRCGRDVSYIELKSSYGHDSFLLEHKRLSAIFPSFLAGIEL